MIIRFSNFAYSIEKCFVSRKGEGFYTLEHFEHTYGTHLRQTTAESRAVDRPNTFPLWNEFWEIQNCVNKPGPRPTFNNLCLNGFNQSLSGWVWGNPTHVWMPLPCHTIGYSFAFQRNGIFGTLSMKFVKIPSCYIVACGRRPERLNNYEKICAKTGFEWNKRLKFICQWCGRWKFRIYLCVILVRQSRLTKSHYETFIFSVVACFVNSRESPKIIACATLDRFASLGMA